MRKFIGFGILAAGLLASAFGANRIGPVSQYGQLQAGKNASGKGQIYGSCKGVTSGNEVQVQGMSLFWSIAGNNEGEQFWNASTVNALVKNQNIQLIRAPMGVDEDWKNQKGNYSTNKTYHQNMMNAVVQAAIDNDIYVIIDYHSYNAINSKSTAQTFFEDMASKWGKYDNVIFEVFNEPLEGVAWSSIKTYAEDILKIIRKYSDNLVVVGSRSWDQYPNDANFNPINDKNVAYTFHFYAGSHSVNSEGSNAVSAMNAGLPVFVSEWGTVNADGGGNVSGASSEWLSWMNLHKLSGANWSVNTKAEGASYFSGSAWNYSASGEWVNTNIFSKLPTSYTGCSAGGSNQSSSSASSSSSSVVLPAGYTDYIDDFEDGDSLAYTGGVWYAYNDNENGASSSFGNTTNKDGFNVILTGASAGNSSKYVAGLTNIRLNQGSYKYDPFVALGVKLNEDESAYDLSKCNTISYKYKGAAHNFKAEDAMVADYGYHQITKAGSTSWTETSVDWDMMIQESWAEPVVLSKSRINKFTWEVKGTQPSQNYLYIDDVRCDGMSIKKPSVTLAGSSSSMASSSSVASSSSRAPLVTEFSTTGKTTQSVVAGNAIEPIVYKFENVTSIVVKDLPVGIDAVLDETAKTYTLKGVVDASSSTFDYKYTIDVTGVDENKTVTGTIKVTRAPVVTTLALTSGNAVQSVIAGESIEPIVYKYENITGVKYTLPKGLTGTKDEIAKTITISGAVDASSATHDYEYTVAVTGLDNNVTLNGTIKVTAIPPQSSSSEEPVVSSSSETLVVSSSSEIPAISSSSVEVVSSSSVQVVVSSSSMTLQPSSSSVAPAVSSSSEAPAISSSSVAKYVISGNLEQTVTIGEEIEPITITGVESYSRKSWNLHYLTFPQQAVDGTITISGSTPSYYKNAVVEKDSIKVNGDIIYITLNILPKSSSSSSEDIPLESSSSEMEGPLNIAYGRPTMNLGFAHNALMVSTNNASVKIQIFDLMGNAMESRMEQVSGSYVMNLDHLNKGSYLVRVTSGSMVKTSRITIK